MSAVGYERTFSGLPTMSALPPTAAIAVLAIDPHFREFRNPWFSLQRRERLLGPERLGGFSYARAGPINAKEPSKNEPTPPGGVGVCNSCVIVQGTPRNVREPIGMSNAAELPVRL